MSFSKRRRSMKRCQLPPIHSGLAFIIEGELYRRNRVSSKALMEMIQAFRRMDSKHPTRQRAANRPRRFNELLLLGED
jgi:hypothetical protein